MRFRLTRALGASYQGLDRRVWLLAGARCINTGGFSIVLPFVAIYLNKHAGASASDVGTLYCIAAIAGGVAPIRGGELSDRVGRRRVMIIALALRAVVLSAQGYLIQRGVTLGA